MGGNEDAGGWEAAAAMRIRSELRALRERFGAHWAVAWGPVPINAQSSYACALFEDRAPECPTVLGLAVPVAGNPWAQAILAEGGAVATDVHAEPRLRIHAQLIEQNRIATIASAADLHGGEARAVVELYARRPMTLPEDPIAEVRKTAQAIAAVAAEAPRRSSVASAADAPPGDVTPAGDSLSAAALHDLKNALAAQSLLIAGFEKELRAAASGSAADAARAASMLDSLAVLRESVMHASDLARVMTLAALPPDARVPIDLPGLARLALAALPPDLRDRFVVDADPALAGSGIARGAPALLRAVLNLLQNAALAIQRVAGARATVAIHRDGDDARIDVADEGKGVSPDVLDRLFEPGVTTRDRPDGHGYGLFTARRAVEALGGSLTLYSIPSRGARFTIRLPMRAISP